MDPSSPTVLHDELGRAFRVVRHLDPGAAGERRLARIDAGGLSRLVVLEFPRFGPDGLGRVRDEVRKLASVDHPAIRSARELATLDGRLAMVTDHVEGADFATLIEGRDPLPRGPVIEVVEQVADALHVVWSRHGIAHGDITARSIWIGVHGNVELLDFGVERGGSADPTRSRRSPSPSADIFALGCVLFQAWTRIPLFAEPGGAQSALTGSRAAYERWLDDRLAQPSLGPIADLLRGMLAHDPPDRPGALAVADRCDLIASGMPMRQTLRRWARERRAESGPTERVTAVSASRDAEAEPPDVTRGDLGAYRIAEMITETDLEEPTANPARSRSRGSASTAVAVPEIQTPSDLGPETPPTLPRPILEPPAKEPFRVARPGPIVSRPPAPEPAPLAPPPGREVSQAPTRWLAPVEVDDEPIPGTGSGSGVLVASVLSVIGGGLLLAAAWVTGTLETLLP